MTWWFCCTELVSLQALMQEVKTQWIVSFGLKLKQMVELSCAPKISHNEIGYPKFLPQECVSVRSTLFPAESVKANCCTMRTLYYGLDHWFTCGPSSLKVNIHMLRTVQGNCIILCIFVKFWQKGTSCSSPIQRVAIFFLLKFSLSRYIIQKYKMQ